MQPISRSPYLGNIDLPLMKVTLRDFITEKCKHPGWSICMRPWFLGLGFTVFTVPTASKQGLRPCIRRLRRAFACGGPCSIPPAACSPKPRGVHVATKERETQDNPKHRTQNTAKRNWGVKPACIFGAAHFETAD